MSVRLDEPRAATELEIPLNDRDSHGTGSGGPTVPGEPPRKTSEIDPDRAATAPNTARLFIYFGMFWIVALFGTLVLAMESRWVHASDWFAIPLPAALYANSAVLIGSSVAIEFARRSLRAGRAARAARAIYAAAILSVVFLAGQLFAWRQLAAAGSRAAENPGSYFFYLITGAHGALLLLGLAFLGSLAARFSGAPSSIRNQRTLGNLAVYWHFLDALWLGLFALLLASLS
jgi:cytochrome c oxidase subunit 3